MSEQIPERIPLRPLGRTGVKVSALGLGGHHLGDVTTIDEAVELVHEALDPGITFADLYIFKLWKLTGEPALDTDEESEGAEESPATTGTSGAGGTGGAATSTGACSTAITSSTSSTGPPAS